METQMHDHDDLLETLRTEHNALEARLHELLEHPAVTPDEEFQVHELKKLKLLKKDQIERLSRAPEQAQA